MKDIRIVLTGYGTVGEAFVRLLQAKQEAVRAKYGIRLRLTGLVGRDIVLSDEEGLDLTRLLGAGRGSEALHRYAAGAPASSRAAMPAGDLLLEATPTNVRDGEPGLTYMKEAIERGMDVVAISKGALVAGWSELMREADASGIRIRYSGATAAALPTLDLGLMSLAGCEIERIEGILNGTTNFILTRMHEDGSTYEEALAEAQRRGIAETNPELDVSGTDSACKLLLLANRLLDANLTLGDVAIRGIDMVTTRQILEAREHGQVWKLVATASRDEEGQVRAAVQPQQLEKGHPLAGIHGTEKAVTFRTDTMGAVTAFGGASSPTGAAAAALKDIINLYRRDRV